MPRTITTTALILAAGLLASPTLAHAQGGAGQPQRSRGGAAVAPAPMAEGEDLRVYDLRDLAAVLPPQRDGAPPTDTLVATLAHTLGIEERRLLDGVYAVIAPADTHAVLQENLERIRALHGEIYHLTITAFSVDAASAPDVGSPAAAPIPNGAPVARISSSIPRRVATPVESTREITYIGDWTPVVGDSAVGYDATPNSEVEGLRLVATVGAAPDAPAAGAEGADGAGELLQLSGHLQRVELRNISAPALTATGEKHDAVLPIALPTVDTRHIHASLRVPAGRPTVVAVVDGFEPGRAIVVTATVTKPARPPAAAQPQPRR